MGRVSVIICAYNEIKFVEQCLSNLQKIRDTELNDLKVIVKDNASTDGTAEVVEQKFPWVKLIRGENKGLSYGYNIGYKASDTEFLLFLGMDAFPEAGTIPGLIEYFDKNEEVGASTCKLVLNDGSLDMDAHRGFPTPWISLTRLLGLHKIFPNSETFNGYFLPGRNMNEPHEIDLCISHFMFTRRKVLDQIDGFDEDFFLYGEDVDVCYRIKKAGWKLMYLPQFTAKHMKGGSVGIRKTTRDMVKKPLQHRLKMQRLTSEAMALFVKKHYMDKYPKLFVYLMLISSRLLGYLRVFVESLRR